jgi:hypothetical protein
MSVSTWYGQVGINWLVPLFPPRHYLLLGLGGRLGVASMDGAVSIRQNFPSGPGIPFDGGHDVSSRAFSQGLVGRASWLATSWMSLDFEAMYENVVFTQIKIHNGRGYLKGLEDSQTYDTTGTNGPMTWNFSGPSFRGGLTFYFKTPIAALRAPSVARPAGEDEQRQADAQRRSGDALLKAGLLPEALDAYQSAIKLDGGNTRAWYGLGSVYYRQKDYKKALDAYERALAQDPDNKPLASYVNQLKIWWMRKNGQLSQ